MRILDELNDRATWLSYLEYKKQSGHLHPMQQAALESFVAQARYSTVTQRLAANDFSFALPSKIMVAKKRTGRKRVVYRFPEEEAMVLKVLNFLISRYDHIFSDACYSFRIGRGVKDAVQRISGIPNLQNQYAVKVDICDYFNSIPAERLISMIEEAMADDEPLVAFLSYLFRRGQAIRDGQTVTETMGVISGAAIAGFFANLYLTDVDAFFVQQGIPYFRYSDDILLFTDTEEKQQEYLRLLTDKIREKGLSLNPEKITLARPGEQWEYLGFSYIDGEFDLADITVTKVKMRIRRYAKYLYREKRQRCGMDYEETVALLLRRFNAMFYDEFDENEFAWNRWYFPVITSDTRLKQVDACLQQYIRYLYSGRHYKGNYKITYGKMKQMGYRSLVHEYYKRKVI